MVLRFTPPHFGQLLQRGLAMGLYERFERRGIRDLVRVASPIAHFRLHIARGCFARPPRRHGLVRRLNRVTCLLVD
jgi:hypothetical protein